MLKKILDLHYWVESFPGTPDVRFWRLLFGVSVIVVALGIVAGFMMRRYSDDGLHRRLWSKIAAWCWTIGPVAALLGFFRFQNVYLFSIRLWIGVWLVFALVWIIFIVRFRLFIFPRRLREREDQNQFKKYLPHRR